MASPDLSHYAAVRKYLFGLKHHGAKYGIDRMQLLSARLGQPERAFPVIHVAGTNGKGSVCAMLEAIYRRCGYRTGLYTSPHLVRQGERIQVNRKLMEESEIVWMTGELQPHAEALAAVDPDDHPSFFEFMTAMAFLKFKREAVDLGIIETGLGGRLDATNIVAPELTVITSVSLDHVEILGDTVEKIAREKAGIIKPGVPVALGRLRPEAEAVIREVATERGSPVHTVAERWGEDPAYYPETNLAGTFQRANAALALLAAELLNTRFPVNENVARAALRVVDWPGRWQELEVDRRHFVLDSTHNPEGCTVLAENLENLVRRFGKKPDIVAGTLGEFRARHLMPTVAAFAENLFLVTPSQPRAVSTAELKSCIPADFSGEVIETTVPELFPVAGVCHAGSPGGTLVVTGSIYLIGEVSDRLFRDVPVSEGILQDPI